MPHGVPRPAALDADYGEPLELCRADPARPRVFTRRWSKATVSLDCDAFEATTTLGAVSAAAPSAHDAPATCEDLANNGTFDLSHEGSWSYLHLDPKKQPFSIGTLGFSTYSDWSPHGPLIPSLLDFSSDLGACRICDGCYRWRPDYVTMTGDCGSASQSTPVFMEVAYHSNSSFCARYSLGANGHHYTFSGRAPNQKQCTSNATAPAAGGGRAVVVEMHAWASYRQREPNHGAGAQLRGSGG